MSYLNIRAPFAKRAVDSPEQLWSCFMEYIAHSDANRLVEPKIFNGKTGIVHGELERIRPYTLNGLCNYIGIHPNTWSKWKRAEKELAANDPAYNEYLMDVLLQIESIIYDQQYQGAVLDIFNATMVSRKLGLADKTEVTGKDGGPIRQITMEMTPQEAAEAYAATLDSD